MSCIPALIIYHLSFSFDQHRRIDPTLAPIRVAPKPKRRKRTNNVFLDDQGFKDLSDDYDHVLHNVDGGPILRKLRHPAPALDADIDPAFHSPFVPAKHEDQMRKDLDLSHLDPNLQVKSTYLSENIGLSSMRRVCLFRSKIMNASSTQERHGPSQSRKSCTENARQSLCVSASRP